MATTSFPAFGHGGFSIAQWADDFESADGIIDDFASTAATSAFNLTRIDASNIARIGTTGSASKCKVNGYTLTQTDTDDFSCPNPVSTTTYNILVKYDPALNVADGSGNAVAAGPCRLVVVTGTPSTSAGEEYFLLWSITRAPGQALSATTVVDHRKWIGPKFLVREYQGATIGSGPFPRGSRLVETKRTGAATMAESIRDLADDGLSLIWRNLDVEAPKSFPAASGLVSWDAAPSAPQYFRYARCMVKCRGTLKRASGANLNTGAQVTLGTFPVGFRPLMSERFICRVGPGTGNQTEVRVDPNGAVNMQDTPAACTFVDLASIFFRAEQ